MSSYWIFASPTISAIDWMEPSDFVIQIPFTHTAAIVGDNPQFNDFPQKLLRVFELSGDPYRVAQIAQTNLAFKIVRKNCNNRETPIFPFYYSKCYFQDLLPVTKMCICSRDFSEKVSFAADDIGIDQPDRLKLSV